MAGILTPIGGMSKENGSGGMSYEPIPLAKKNSSYLEPVVAKPNPVQQSASKNGYMAPILTGISGGWDATAGQSSQPQTSGEAVFSALGTGLQGGLSAFTASGFNPIAGGIGALSGLVFGGLNSYLTYNRGKREQARIDAENAIASARKRKIDKLNEADIRHGIAIQDENLKMNKEQFAYKSAMDLINSKLPSLNAYMQSDDARRNRYHATGMM